MSTNSNKKNGNHFEEEFCELLALHGFWAHNMAQNQVGQPADVIAVKNGIPVLIDCKVERQDKNGALFNWEKGKSLPSMYFIKPLCETLGITINQLFAKERDNDKL